MTLTHLPQLRDPKPYKVTGPELIASIVTKLHNQSPLLVPERILSLVGADANPDPAGILQVNDAIEVVPGTNVTVDGQSLSSIWEELLMWLSAFNAQADALVAMLSFTVTEQRTRIAEYTNPGFQRASEFGEPNEIGVEYVYRGYPLVHRDLKIGFTQEFLDESLGSEVLGVRVTAEAAWRTLLKNHVLAAIFGSTNYTDRQGNNVVRLYNNDGEVPPEYKNWTHAGTHTHYLTSGAATHDAADVSTMVDHVVHHGFGDVDDSVFTLHQHRDDVAISRALPEWVPAESSSVPEVTTGPIVGLRTGRNGLRVQGYLGEAAVIENNDIQPGYHLLTATGGAFTTQNPVAFRVHRNPAARGLRLQPGPNGQYPIRDAVYDGYVGAGIRHRSSAVVMQSTAGAYADPVYSL